MSGRGSSSAHPTEPDQYDLHNGVIAYDTNQNGTYIKIFGLRERPSWLDLMRHGQALHEYLVSRCPDYRTNESNTRLVATLCIARSPTEYRIFQSSIPRGGWRRWMQYTGPDSAPTWYQAAHARPQDGSSLVPDLHAEDSAEYLANTYYPDFNTRAVEPARMIVYGEKRRREGVRTMQQDVCYGESRKNPSCTEVAGRLRIEIPPHEIWAEDMDEADPYNPSNARGSGGHRATRDYSQTYAGGSSSAGGGGGYSGGGYSGGGYSGGGSYSAGGGTYYSGGSHSHQHNSRSKPEDSRHASRHADPTGLSTAMSTLSVGSRDKHTSTSSRPGGGSSSRIIASTTDRDYAPRTRPSSDGRAQSSSTKGPASSKSSASRTSGRSRRGE